MNTELLVNGSMVFLRAGALLAVFPVFSAPAVPVKLRVALGAALAMLLAPAVPPADLQASDTLGWVGVMALEVGTGLLLGFICRIMFFALEMAGGIISTEIGLNLPGGFNPMMESQATVPGALLNLLGTILWLTLDLHHWMLVGFRRSFELLPIGAARLNETILEDVLAWTGGVFVVGLQMAAPVMAVSFILALVFSVLGRAVPQMNVFSESFAVRLFAGLTVFGASMPLMAQHIANYFGRLPEDMLRIAALLAR